MVDKIWSYAAQGGRVLVVPESLLGDEYNHPKDCADGNPAVIRVALGDGTVYYEGSSFDGRSYARLLGALFEEARVIRPVRLRAQRGSDKWNIKARFAQSDKRELLYVVNLNQAPARLRVQAPGGFFSSLLDLRARRQIEGTEITVPTRQTAIYELH